MRSLQRDELLSPRHLLGLLHGAAGDESAHAVAEQDDLRYRHLPGPEDFLESGREFATILGHMKTAILGHIERGGVQIACQRLSVVVSVPLPFAIIHR